MKKYFVVQLPSKSNRLFLCTRELKIGDDIITNRRDLVDTRIIGEKSLAFYQRHGGFKPIGAISSNAVWVRDGDEFSEEDINPHRVLNQKGSFEKNLLDEACEAYPEVNSEHYNSWFETVMQIKGPGDKFY